MNNNNIVLKDYDLNKTPLIYKSVVGSPYRNRLVEGIETDEGVLGIIEIKEFDVEIQFGFGDYTLRHNLGKRPLVLGMYEIVSASTLAGGEWEVGQKGFVPEFRKTNSGSSGYMQTQVTTSLKNSTYLTFDMPDLDGTIRVKLYLLREDIV